LAKKHTNKKQTKHDEKQVNISINKDILITAIVTALIVLAVVFGIQIFTKGSTGSNNYGGDGVVTIVEFSDFECPFCARVQPTLKQVKDIYGDKVEIVYKHFPLSFHPNAQKAGEASECARDQGKFWEYHDILFANQDRLSVANLKQYAVQLGLDTTKFNECLDSNQKAAIVLKDMAEGQAAGISGTPGFLINGELLTGAQPLAAFQAVIDRKLQDSGSAPSRVTTTNTGSDPVIQMTVINDATCSVCDSQAIIDITQRELFPTAQVTVLDKSDAQAQQLITQLGITALPAYVFDNKIAQAANFNQIVGALVQKGDSYIIAPGAAGNVKLIQQIDVTGRPMKGNPNAPVTIVEFSDFECPFCAKFFTETYPQIVSEYVNTGKANLVYMHFPLSFHANARPAAIASECAFEQGKFWEYHDVLFANTNALSNANLKQYAVQLGLDTQAFNSCLDSEKYGQLVDMDTQIGQSVGVSGTSGFIINGVSVTGAQPFSAFAPIIEGELNN